MSQPHAFAAAASPAAHAMADGSFSAWADARRAGVEAALDALLPAADALPAALHRAMRYAVVNGGKRVRPLLVHAAGEALAPAAALDGSAAGRPAPLRAALDLAASAVELVHAYSLVHDDLPCMDNDTLRRGQPTVWVAYGEAQAMLVGDALQALAFEALAAVGGHGVPPAAGMAMVAELSRAAGSLGMAGGQAIDLDAVGQRLAREALEQMHRRKTGALLRASVVMGAIAAAPEAAAPGTPGRDALERYAAAVGLAFQVIDDVLDVEADTATLGKTAGKDSQGDKPTYVSAMGLAAARAYALALRDDALAAIAPLGASARRLAELADLVVLRTN